MAVFFHPFKKITRDGLKRGKCKQMRSRTKRAERRRKTEVVGFFVIVDFLTCKKAGDITQTQKIFPTVPFGVVNLPCSPSAATPFSGQPLQKAKAPFGDTPN